MCIHTHLYALTHTYSCYKFKRLIEILSTTTNKIPQKYTEKEIKKEQKWHTTKYNQTQKKGSKENLRIKKDMILENK